MSRNNKAHRIPDKPEQDICEIEDGKFTWLSLHLFYAQPWEKLILEVIKPVCENLLQQRLITQFFFIRYWEGGPHIRLRLKGEANVLKSKVDVTVRQHFLKFIKDHPSIRQEPVGINSLSVQSWYDNNTIQSVAYKPETDRYGGLHGLPIAERQFGASSRAVIEAMATSIAWSSARALGVAVQMHLSFIHTAGISKNEAVSFFSWIAQNWLPTAINKRISAKDYQLEKDKTLHLFEDRFSKQQESLLPFCLKFWNALQAGVPFDSEWINQWIKEVRLIFASLKEQNEADKLIQPRILHPEKIPQSNRTLWSLFDSYIHMTNNRLGLLNSEESYIAFLLHKILLNLG